MSTARRVAATKIDWKSVKANTLKHLEETVNKFKTQNSKFIVQVQNLPEDLPKIDFAKYKKQLPEHSAILDSLQKQYETYKIPYPTAEKSFKDVDEFQAAMKSSVKDLRVAQEKGAKDVEAELVKMDDHAPFYHQTNEEEVFAHCSPEEIIKIREGHFVGDPHKFGVNSADFLRWTWDYRCVLLRKRDQWLLTYGDELETEKQPGSQANQTKVYIENYAEQVAKGEMPGPPVQYPKFTHSCGGKIRD